MIEFPYIEFWMSDYLQLGFFYEELKTEDGQRVSGMNIQDNFGCNYIYLNLYWISKTMKFDEVMHRYAPSTLELFIEWFLHDWFHEWLHLIGLNEEQIGLIEKGLYRTPEISIDD